MTCKCFVCNDRADLVDALNPYAISISAGDWLFISYGRAKLTIALYYCDYGNWLTKANLDHLQDNSGYNHEFIVGINEPDLANVSIDVHLAKAIEQMDIVLSSDKNARFVIGNTTHENPCYEAGSHTRNLFKRLPKHYQDKVVAISQHCYPPFGIHVMFEEMHNYCDSIGREAWITEIGRPITVVPNANNYTPRQVLTKANNRGIHRVYWYTMSALPNDVSSAYHCLYDGNKSMTDDGKLFRDYVYPKRNAL